jgi:putative transposase
VLRDNGAGFDPVSKSRGFAVQRVGPRSPNMNAVAERWVQSVKQECLDHFVVLGEAPLRHILADYVAYYNEERPHQGMGNAPLGGAPPPVAPGALSVSEVCCRERLGGLLKHYTRRAA